MNTSETLILKLREFEGLRLEAYKDAAGVPTIGYGHTKAVRMGDKITRWWAIETLKKDFPDVRVDGRTGIVRIQPGHRPTAALYPTEADSPGSQQGRHQARIQEVGVCRRRTNEGT